MRLPAGLLRGQVLLAEFLGANATGPVHGPLLPRPAYTEDTTRTTVDGDGRTTHAVTKVWIQLDRAVTPQWRCETDGRNREVLEVAHYEARLGTPDHTLLTLR